MNTLFTREIKESPDSDQHEVTLNAPLILGIFFALALLCGVFFAVGYTFGHSRSQPVAVNTQAPASSDQPVDKPDTGDQSADQASVPAEPPDGSAAASSSSAGQPAAPPAHASPVPARPAAPANRTPAALPSAPAGPVSMVQVAALSHEDDAIYLRTVLEKRGFHVAIVRAPQDKLLRVQVGPFTNRKDAEAARQKLISQGYSPILK
ncbi:MAG: SPOR domain-containing protein [Acidobacteriaceae bacterium]|nr:SPOR domain-containing protein [Acidobacteriaceae bacterium]